MIEPKGVNLAKAFTISGVKEIGGYTYVLLVDFAGLTLIKRVTSDNSEIKFVKKSSGQSIDDFWANPDATGLNYTFIHEL